MLYNGLGFEAENNSKKEMRITPEDIHNHILLS